MEQIVYYGTAGALSLSAIYLVLIMVYIVKIGFTTVKKAGFTKTKKYVKVKMYGDEKIGILKRLWVNIATLMYIESEIDVQFKDFGHDWRWTQAK
jgi:hypothetical protein